MEEERKIKTQYITEPAHQTVGYSHDT